MSKRLLGLGAFTCLGAPENSTYASMLGSIHMPNLHSMLQLYALSLDRPLFVHAVCQTLRILSFSSTQLPSPNYHCRLPELTAIKDMPLHWWGHFIVDLGRQADLTLMPLLVLLTAALHYCVQAAVLCINLLGTCHLSSHSLGQGVLSM